MPKKDIDYSNTIIYKIYCKDNTITDVYVGHTTNFIQRKYAHKIACNNLNNNLKIYNIIRCNGGWENWDMIQIAKYNCKDSTEARFKEQEHYNELKASLNSCPPYVDIKKYFCCFCNIQCRSHKQYDKHIVSIKHIKNNSNTENNLSENNKKYFCKYCNYNTCYSKDFNKHLVTKKHILLSSHTEIIKDIICEICNKKFITNSGLWKHKKQCTIQTPNTGDDKDNLIDKLLKQNSKIIKEQNNIKNLILELFKNIKNKSINLDDNTNKV